MPLATIYAKSTWKDKQIYSRKLTVIWVNNFLFSQSIIIVRNSPTCSSETEFPFKSEEGLVSVTRKIIIRDISIIAAASWRIRRIIGCQHSTPFATLVYPIPKALYKTAPDCLPPIQMKKFIY